MDKNNSLNDLKLHIKNKEPASMYLFFGEEEYGKKLYAERLYSIIDDGGFPDFNKILLEGNRSFSDYDDAIESFPMMCDKKLVIIKNSGIFNKANEEQKIYWQKRFDNLPDYAVLVFDETSVDKRSVLYKSASKIATTVEFSFMQDTELVSWVMRTVLKEGKKISKDVCEYFVSICDEGLANVKNELDKLLAYCDETITKTDVEKIVSKAVGARIFELTDCMMSKNADKALKILKDLKTVKESAFAILYLLCSTFDKMLHSSLLLSQGEGYQEIAKAVGVSPFIAKKYANSARGFGENFLTDRIIEIAEIDFAIKNGEISDWDALEKFVINCCEMI